MQTGTHEPASARPRRWRPGPETTGEGVWLRVASTRAHSVEVELHGDGAVRVVPLVSVGEGRFETFVPGTGAGTRYRVLLDGVPTPDPFARWLPEGPLGLAALPDPPPPADPASHPHVLLKGRSDLVLAQFDVARATPEGTFRAAAARLPALAELGINALLLSPVWALAPGAPTGFYAPLQSLGTPADLRAFVEAAHAAQLGVILQLDWGRLDAAYVRTLVAHSPECARPAPTGGRRPESVELDLASPWTRQVLRDNARLWLDDYLCDGLCLHVGEPLQQPSQASLLDQVAGLASVMDPQRLVLARESRNDASLVVRHGLDGVLGDDFAWQIRALLLGVELQGFRPNLEDVVRTIEQGWLYVGQVSASTGLPRGRPAGALEARQFVYGLQPEGRPHPGSALAGPAEAHGDSDVPPLDLDAGAAAVTLQLFLPMTPLLSAVPGSDVHVPVPDGARSPAGPVGRPGDEGPDTSAARLQPLYRTLLQLKRRDPVLSYPARSALRARVEDGLLVVDRWWGAERRRLVLNPGPSDAVPPAGPEWRVLAASHPEADRARLPARSAVVLAAQTPAAG